MKIVIRLLLGSFIFFLGFAFWAYSHSESYCSIWPSIDTEFAENYNENNFKKVKSGMAKSKVIELLGEPLEKSISKTGVEVWSYSQDKGARFYDFAWLGRFVEFEGEIVVGTVSKIYND